MRVLWPRCFLLAGKLHEKGSLKNTKYGPMDWAKAAFATHAFADTAWTKDFTHDEIKDFIDKLKPGDRIPL